MGNIPWFIYVVIALLTAGLLFVLVVRPKASGTTPTTAPAPTAPAPAAATTPKKPVNWLAIIIGSAGFAVFAAIVAATVFKPTGLGDIDPFWWLSIATIICVLSVGTYKYWPIAGNTSVYIVLALVGFILIFGTTYVVMMKVAPQETEMILGAAKNDIQGAAQGLVKTDPYGGKSIDWQQIGEFNWGKFFGFAFFGICIIAIGTFLLKGNKIVMLAFAVTASILVFPTAFYYSWTFVVPEPVKEFVTGAATTVYEANPALGETRYANLATAAGHRTVLSGIGPYDTVQVYLPPKGCQVGWMATDSWLQQHAGIPGYDPSGHYLYKTAGGSGLQREYSFTEEFKYGLKAANTTLTLEVWATCRQA